MQPARHRRKPGLSELNPFERLLRNVRPAIERELKRELGLREKEARKLGEPVSNMVAALTSLCLRGGKRLRAGLVAAGYQCVHESSALPRPVIQAGVALELLQAYFLIHDDWMDRDEVRRGGPSVHSWLTTKIGDTHLGAAAGVLTGDYALALATHMLSRVPSPKQHAQGIWGCFARMQLDAVAGQQRDLLGAEDVLLTYRLKTASYSVHGPLELGARMAGAAAPLLRALKKFALPTGLAFQIRDDLLNAFGEPSVTGKPLGSDLTEGKRTLLVMTALNTLRGPARTAFLTAFNRRKATLRQRTLALEALQASGAVEVLELEILKLAAAGERALHSPRVPPAGRELLRAATASLLARNS